MKAYLMAISSATQEVSTQPAQEANIRYGAVNLLVSQALTHAQLTTVWELSQPYEYLQTLPSGGGLLVHHAAKTLARTFPSFRIPTSTPSSVRTNSNRQLSLHSAHMPDVGPDATIANIARRSDHVNPRLQDEHPSAIDREYLRSITMQTPWRIATGLTFAPQLNFRLLRIGKDRVKLALTTVQLDTMSNVNLMSLRDAHSLEVTPVDSGRTIDGSTGVKQRVNGFIPMGQLSVTVTSSNTFDWKTTCIIDSEWLVLDEEYLEGCPLLGVPFIRAVNGKIDYKDPGPTMSYEDSHGQSHSLLLSYAASSFVNSLKGVHQQP